MCYLPSKMYCWEECTFKLRTDNYFVLTSGKEVVILFQSRFFGAKLPSELIFAQSVLKIYRLLLTVVCASINV